MRTALLFALLTPIGAAPEALHVQVPEGTSIAKAFTSSISLELADYTVEVNGETQDTDEVPEVSIEDAEEVAFTDEYVKVDDGRVLELVRTFDVLSDTSVQTMVGPDGEEQEQTSEGESDLEGVAVRFQWDDDDEEWSTSFVEEGLKVDEELLEDLDVDGDLTYWMPAKDDEVDLEEGASWEIEVSAFNRLSWPGGDLHIDEEDEDDEANAEFEEQFRDNMGGSLEARIVSVEDGEATITISGEVETTVTREPELPEGAPDEAEWTQELQFFFECEGELVWNLELGTPVSFTLGGGASMQVTNNQKMGEEFELLITEDFDGTYEHTASFE